MHKAAVTEVDRNKPIAPFFPAATSTSRDVIKAEVMVTSHLIYNITHQSPPLHILETSLQLDSKTAKLHAYSATKTRAIINKAMGPHCHEYVVKLSKQHPLSFGIDGSSVNDVKKMNPVTIRIFISKGQCV